MITLELVEYIKSQLNKNISKDLVVSNLLEAGWRIEDIQEGFLRIDQVKIEEPEEVKKNIDRYREPADDTDPLALKEEVKEEKKEESTLGLLKVWTPTNIQPVIIKEEPIVVEEIKKIEPEEPKSKLDEIKAIVEKEMAAAAVTTPEIPVVEPSITPVTPIISTPPVGEFEFKIKIPEETKKDEKIEFSTSKELEPYNLEIKGEEQIIPAVVEPVINEVQPVISAATEPVVEEVKPVIPATEPISVAPLIPNIPTKISTPTTPSNVMSDIVPRNAMLSSYSRDLLNMTKKEEEVITATPTKKKKILKITLITIGAILIVGGMIFSFVEGYLKIPWSNLSFLVVKRDPKVVLLNAYSNISDLKSYKVDTLINISVPALSNITTGLSSGTVVTSNERDSISINTKGIVSHKDLQTIFDYNFNFNSSLLKNDIKTDWKYDGSNFSIAVPKLGEILGKDAPAPAVVSMKKNELGLIVGEFSDNVQGIIKNIDIYNIISNGVPPFVQDQTITTLKEFIGTLEFVEKGKESIHGIETYHYEVTVTRPATKKLLSSFVDLFSLQISEEQKKNLDEALGASSISSFEVWVGKNDDNLYQIKFTLNAPLSKVLRLNDSGIANNEVKLDWMTTFYDLDVENSIVMPSEQMNIKDFVNDIENTKIKNIISAFKPQATLFKNAVGSYGKKSEALGSCTLPLSGSLFSPLGQSKGADTAISSISSSMSSLLLLTKGEGSCYSTSKAWALAAPLYTTPISYYCASSEGDPTTLTGPINGTTCSTPEIVPVAPIPTTPVIEKNTNTPVVPPTPPIIPKQ
ncbi:MAG: hypothetical protein WCW04_03160 [Candidatus Paceibacterota bacterium]